MMSRGIRVFFIQKPSSRWSGNTKIIPWSAGTESRSINPRWRVASLFAISSVYVCDPICMSTVGKPELGPRSAQPVRKATRMSGGSVRRDMDENDTGGSLNHEGHEGHERKTKQILLPLLCVLRVLRGSTCIYLRGLRSCQVRRRSTKPSTTMA